MTTNGHSKGSIDGRVCHKEGKIDTNRFDMRMTKLSEILSKLMKLLHKSAED